MTEKNNKKKPTTAKPPRKNPGDKKKYFDISFYHDWCKACGICMAFCPKKIIKTDNKDKPEIIDMDDCIGCRFCEIHCPDFAITVSERIPKRRHYDV